MELLDEVEVGLRHEDEPLFGWLPGSGLSTKMVWSNCSRNTLILVENHCRSTSIDFINSHQTSKVFYYRILKASDNSLGTTCINDNLIIRSFDSNSLRNDPNQVMNTVVDKFLSRVKILEREGKKQESIKEVHKIVEGFIKSQNIEVANQALKLSVTSGFSLAVLIAFLSVTMPFKDVLSNRKLVYNKAEEVALNKMGENKLNKSVFSRLK